MDRKIKLLAASSLVAVLASGCAPYNAKTGTYDNSYSGFGSGASQSPQVAPSACGTCTPQKSTYQKSTYTKYTPPKSAGGHTQQWYIDRWNRQQQQHKPKPKPKYTPPAKTYSGYGGAKPSTNSYYDYSKAGGYSTSNKNTYTGSKANNSATNKSIYTGNYSNNTYKPYAPKTYTSGANSNNTYVSSGGSNNTSYSSSHGGGEVATGAYSAGASSYSVRKGDTVFSVMRLTGVYWKDIIKMNGLQKPSYTISPGQRLRLK